MTSDMEDEKIVSFTVRNQSLKEIEISFEKYLLKF